MFYNQNIDKIIKELGYKTNTKYESEEPGLRLLEENSDRGLIARLEVNKKGFYKKYYFLPR